ncbi:MAG: hypothetical protein J6127_05470, partial [Clostridiales bacterium]|nr:hypothetical protein [Clostridiales bacterium]
MFNFAKRATSAVIAGAVVLGTLAFYPYGDKARVNAATLYDSASAINYATILGGAVDYGVVADTITQNSHTETTFATHHFIHNSDNIDVDYISSTALFIVGEDYQGNDSPDPFSNPWDVNKYIRFGKTTASAIYFEAPSKVFDLQNPVSPFDPSKEAKRNTTNGVFRFEGEYDDVKFIQAVNENAKTNVKRLIDRICSTTVVEDAEKGWSYFLEDRAKDPNYVLNPDGQNCTEIKKFNSYIEIDLTDSKYDGRVVYINVNKSNGLISYLQESDGFRINKNESSVVVINIADDAFEGSKLTMIKPRVTVNGTGYFGNTGTNGKDPNAANVQKYYNESIIWNIMETSDIELDSFGGAVLAPVTKNVRLSNGNSSGWVVTSGSFDMSKEFHFLYSGSSKDSYGDMHFALTKAFTEKYAEHGSAQLKQDTSVSVTADTYQFTCDEYLSESKERGEFQNYYRSLTPVYAQTDATVTFPILTFYCDNYDQLSEVQKHYYVEKGKDKLFFFKIKETYAAPHVVSGSDGRYVSHSDGYIDVRLKVSVDTSGRFTYFVDYQSVTGKDAAGNNIIFRKYGEVYGNFITMSGVQFDFGSFYNQLVPLDVNISKRDINKPNGDEVKGAKLSVEYIGKDDKLDLSGVTLVCDGKDVTANATISKKKVEFTSGDKLTTIVGIKPGDYVLKETTAPEGYKPQTTSINFTVGDDGTVTATSAISDKVGKIENKDTVVILDEPLPTVNISKRDVNQPNGAEVPGATLKVDYIGSDDSVDLSNVLLTRSGTAVAGTKTKKSVEFVSGDAQTVITGLQPGNYTLTETTSPKGYEKQQTVIGFTVGADGTVTATSAIAPTVGMIENGDTVVILDEKTPNPITVNISKQDINQTNGAEVAGATLEVKYLGNDASVDLTAVTLERSGNNVTNTATLSTKSILFKSGTAQTAITGLKPGDYSLTETIAPDNYELQQTVILFTVGADGKVSATSTIPTTAGKIENEDTVIILDEKTPAPITVNISKQDINQTNGAEVAGATLKVTYVGSDRSVDLSKVTLSRSGSDVTSQATRTTSYVSFTSAGA